VFSPKDSTFYVTNFTDIYEKVESTITATKALDNPQNASLKTKLKYHLRPYIPARIRRSAIARQIATKSIAMAMRSYNRARLATKSFKIIPKTSSSKCMVFQKDDVVLILGKPWDNPNIQKALAKQKSETGFKLVQIVYDLIISLQPQLHHPSLFVPYTQNMFEAISDSDLLLPISKSSARDLDKFCKRLNLRVPKTEVIRIGDEINPNGNFVKPDERIKDQFIACVGTIEIRKNHMLLYYVYKLGLEKGINLPQLIIVGKRGWLSGDFQYLVENDPAIKDKVIILDNVNDAGLSWVYKNCLFTVYPSIYEGWGLPVAESLAYGKMCIASNRSSIPEIAGDLIDYFSPYSAEECLTCITKYLQPDLLNSEEQIITKNNKQTSWFQTFQQVHTAIISLEKTEKV